MAKFGTTKEKKAFCIGLAVGRKSSRGKSSSVKRKDKPRYLGPTCVNGKFYDTNFKKPVKFTREQIRDLHMEYDPSGNSSDAQVVDRFVKHMRTKYGRFSKSGEFLGMLGDK